MVEQSVCPFLALRKATPLPLKTTLLSTDHLTATFRTVDFKATLYLPVLPGCRGGCEEDEG